MKNVLITVALLLTTPAFAGTYTPTATDVAHAQTTNVAVAKHYTVDGIVHISGSITVASDDSTALTEVRLTLPTSSALTSADDCHGVIGEAANFNTGSVSADPATDQLKISFLSSISDALFQYPLEVKFTADCEIK